MKKAGLYGIKNSNRDFTKEDSWGKNQFNNAFPVALACYMHSKNIKPVYLKINQELNINKDYIEVLNLFGVDPLKKDVYYSFEDKFQLFDKFNKGSLPGIDLVIKEKNIDIKAIEIKLTTLPDNSTYKLEESKYGSEIVVRPDTIVYQAFSIAQSLHKNKEEVLAILDDSYKCVENWNEKDKVIPHLSNIRDSLEKLLKKYNKLQKPLLMQPIWKTQGKSAILAENCLDVFIWSDFSFTRLFFKEKGEYTNIDRPTRSMIWLFLMLYDFAKEGKIDHKRIIDTYTYDTKNDKAFSANGNNTNKLMQCDELTKPRIKKQEIKNIILGDGQLFLSPERRFDGVIQSNTSLFD
ncbi:putative type-2 restriction enzyme HindVP [Clostridium polyendosporum]|uniref:Type-2 restriction enzyme HindVP n=1 Tax=Clostridium polyendosporum TaxID=69208 RepID=A0A919VF38_9CLOT|nr:HindVP family restriction endonuclease [Clostridium polyendosporum]GIM29849.1 putative type-2 restriction enzyme HindVP [Clostridium polyendosporum]